MRVSMCILPCTFHSEKTSSVGWSVWRVLKSSSWANATLPAQLTNHDMIFSQKQSVNIWRRENSKKPATINLVATLLWLFAFAYAWSRCIRWPIEPTFHLLSISNDVYGFHRICVLVPYFEQFFASVDEIMNLKNWIKSIPLHMVRFLST